MLPPISKATKNSIVVALQKGDTQAAVKALWGEGVTSPDELNEFLKGVGGVDANAVQGEFKAFRTNLQEQYNQSHQPVAPVVQNSSTSSEKSSAAAPVPKSARETRYDDVTAADAWYNDPGYQIDPELGLDQLHPDEDAIAGQKGAMNDLFDLYHQGGASAQDRAFQADNRAATEQWNRSQRDADLQDYAERGMGGSGSELLSMLADRGNAADRLSQSDVDLQAQHEKRAMDALLNGENIASDVRSSSFNEAGTKVDMIREAAKDNTDWFRKQYADTMARRHQDAQQNRQLGFNAADSIYGYDQNDDQHKYDKAAEAADNDANRYTTGNLASASNLTGEDYSGDTYGRAGTLNNELSQGSEKVAKAGAEIHEGAGQAGDGALGLVGAFAGGGGGGGVGGVPGSGGAKRRVV